MPTSYCKLRHLKELRAELPSGQGINLPIRQASLKYCSFVMPALSRCFRPCGGVLPRGRSGIALTCTRLNSNCATMELSMLDTMVDAKRVSGPAIKNTTTCGRTDLQEGYLPLTANQFIYRNPLTSFFPLCSQQWFVGIDTPTRTAFALAMRSI